MAKIKAKLWRRQILELEQLFYVLWLRIEVEKFNFREHLIKFSLLPPWVQNKTLKLYKSHQFKLCCKKSSRYCNKKMVFNQLKCIIYTNVIIWYLLAAIPSVEVFRAKNIKKSSFSPPNWRPTSPRFDLTAVFEMKPRYATVCQISFGKLNFLAVSGIAASELSMSAS